MLGKAQGLFPNSEAKGKSSEKALNETPNSELRHDTFDAMATPFLAGLAVAATALAGRYGIQAWHAFKTRPPKPRMRKFYEGGFQQAMTKREAALILGIRENAPADKVKEAHRKVMVANHPDAGGSHYLASKINEAKDVMLGKTKGSGSAF
ncbi:mitochondrial import inner membrane translocase subunit TIM14-1 [Prunus avium]|uniref:Mitochondrial import inner membrane translocase subunit TIM14-1 n=1 Tax=Prunus avium TaxID=42229 RepID=A0A6P5SXY9_PRUAV|nr:mitochondrial import inner membrane translocase subunit TIM14-1 [Prunus avium]